MTTIIAKFVKMTPYYAHMCILGWQTMLMLGIFIVFAQNKPIFHFVSVKNGFICEGPTKKPIQNWKNKK
jgi:hypothetical protein